MRGVRATKGMSNITVKGNKSEKGSYVVCSDSLPTYRLSFQSSICSQLSSNHVNRNAQRHGDLIERALV